jgi:CRP/FNR family transcriptional regulator
MVSSFLCTILFFLHRTHVNKDSELTIDVTRDVMATCIGTTKETLIRSLSDFKDRKWIGINKNKIELLNRKVLSDLAEIVS